MSIPTAFMTDRLATLLQQVWQSIPKSDQESITKYWSSAEQHSILNLPVFAVTDPMVDGKALGATNMHGFMLRFWKDFVDRGYESKVRDIIAHELAHVFDLAMHGRAAELTEAFAEDTMKRWGFDPNSVKDDQEDGLS
jgi:hypothetical protein